jgi:DNA-binding transcriptional regulator GbsR (MarR family)
MSEHAEQDAVEAARDDFIAGWGAIGSSWGVSRTMAQIHALLMTTEKSMSTDMVMESLAISRGNANTNLRELVHWGLLRPVLMKGERKEYFEAEKDPWRIFRIIVRERKRRELDPAVEVLKACVRKTEGLDSPDAQAIHRQACELRSFLADASSIMNRVAESDQNLIFTLLMKALK